MAATATALGSRTGSSLLGATRVLLAVGVPTMFGLLNSLRPGAPPIPVTIVHAVAIGVVATPLRELISQLDAAQFVQVHRSVVVNLSAIDRVVRAANETADIYLNGRDDVLPVSRNYLHLFRQM